MPAPVPEAILANTSSRDIREAMLLGSYLEGGWSPPFGVGDFGTSFGPYQIHHPENWGLTRAQAEDPVRSTDVMYGEYLRGFGQLLARQPTLPFTNPELAAETTAFYAERPAKIYHETQGQTKVDQGWQATLNVLREASVDPGPQPTPAPMPSGNGDVSDSCKQALNDVLSGKISKAECTAICGTPCTSGGYPGQGVVGGITGTIGSVADAIHFIFSLRFLEVLGGGLLILIAVVMLARQQSA
jgi:hypothetical protein